MSIQSIKENIGDFAKDIRLNISKVLSEEGSDGLSLNQTAGVAIACAYSLKNNDLAKNLISEFSEIISENEIQAAKSAAAIMAMNNIYYRFVHMASDKQFAKMPANLRMNVIANPPIDKIDFELYALAVSAINGCGMCIDAHVNQLKSSISYSGIQSSIRIASVINAVDSSLHISN